MREAKAAASWQRRERAFAITTFVSFVVSALSLTVSLTASPLLSAFAETLRQSNEYEVRYCAALIKEVTFLEVVVNSTRPRRDVDDDDCACEFPQGAPGLPGREGLPGRQGTPGAPGMPARLPCEEKPDIARFCPDPCPVGRQGKPGPMGPSGDPGEPGTKGQHGKPGENGKQGMKGEKGPRGVPGLDGIVGDPGEDAQPMPFIPGPPGESGDLGPPGPKGPVGMPGIDGPRGPAGVRGPKGENGLPGGQGEPGILGQIGEPGKEGEKGVCPTYCATDGGVFFVQPPDWFFNRR